MRFSRPDEEAAPDGIYEVRRVDDNGNEFVVAMDISLEEAERLAAMYAARAHRQTYMVLQARASSATKPIAALSPRNLLAGTVRHRQYVIHFQRAPAQP